jgi:hypothetical protein
MHLYRSPPRSGSRVETGFLNACAINRATAGQARSPLAKPVTSVNMNLPAEPDTIKEPRLWRDNGWTARVIKNEDDEGWAVSMTPDGQSEPALVGPWTMGRDKKNPKPLDTNAFNTLVKTAHEVVRRHEQHLQATLHKAVEVAGAGGSNVTVTLDIVPDEFEPYALLAARDAEGETLARIKVSAGFKLNTASAQRWVDGGFARPA